MNASVFEPPLPDGEEKRRIINAEKAAGKDTSRHPVETVDWDEATEFCRRLSAMAGESRFLASLPPTDGGRMGIFVPCRNNNSLVLR